MVSNWTEGMYAVSPLWVGLALSIGVAVTIAYLLWTTLKSRRS